MYLLALALLVPLGVLALAVGVTQALLTGYGLLRHRWVLAKLIILGVLIVAAVAVAVPGLGRAAYAATSPGVEVAAAQQFAATLTPTTAVVLFIVATWLGVFKPGRSLSVAPAREAGVDAYGLHWTPSQHACPGHVYIG